MNHRVIYRSADRYAAFPHVAQTPVGTLIAVFREAGQATARRALTYDHTHQDLDSRVFFSASEDSGATWKVPVCIHECDRYGVNDPAVTVLRDGSYLVRFARWRLVSRSERNTLEGPIHRHLVREGQVGMTDGNGFVQSTDGGDSWNVLESVVEDGQLKYAMSREPVLELEDGTFLLPVYEGYPAASERAWLLRSWNRGQTWNDASLMAGELDRAGRYRQVDNFNEASILALEHSTLLAVIRRDSAFEARGTAFLSEGGVGELVWTLSQDAGMTWETVRPAGIWGQPANLLRLKDGSILCTHGYRRQPFGVRASLVILGNGEARVARTIVLRDDGASWDVGYPSSVQISADEIFTIYYVHGGDGVRHIAGTTWRLEEMMEGGGQG